MLIEILRLSSTEESTIGSLSIDGVFQCFTVEDPWHADKKAGVTRIPALTYDLQLREEGGMHTRYNDRFSFHEGMLWLQDVPEFEWVYIHTGNTAKHSQGCIIVGDTLNNNTLEEGFVGSSVAAYSRIYQKILPELIALHSVTVSVRTLG